MINTPHQFAMALIDECDHMRLLGVEDIQEHAPDGDAEVVMVHLDNGYRLLVTIAPLYPEDL